MKILTYRIADGHSRSSDEERAAEAAMAPLVGRKVATSRDLIRAFWHIPSAEKGGVTLAVETRGRIALFEGRRLRPTGATSADVVAGNW